MATAVVTASGAGASARVSSWSPTATRSLAPLLVKATNFGAANDSTRLRIDVALPARNAARLAALAVAESTPGTSAFGKYLTSAQYLKRFGPTATSVSAVTSYLSKKDFKGIAVDSNRLMITGSATVGAIETAFNTRLDTFNVGGHRIYANVKAASVPNALASDVGAVLGLNDLRMNAIRPMVASPKAPLAGYYPKEFQTVYDATKAPTGSKSSIAVFAEGDLRGVISDLRYAEQKQKLPQVPVTVVRTGPATTDTANAIEWDLDTQVSTGMAQSVKRLFIYDVSTMTDTDFAHAINVWASQDKAVLGSASIGEPDALAWADGSMFAIDTAVEEAAAQGQSFFASTGDTGASCALVNTNGVPDTGVTASLCYPADGTWTTAVGGTTLVTDANNNYTTELAWNAGGGGLSYLEYPGPWTDLANQGSAGGFRGSPDIAMDADLTTGANIYVAKVVNTIGGTSVASPLAMGAIARIESGLHNKLGIAVVRFYGLYNKANPAAGDVNAVPGFHDIVAGSNGLYAATPGWDYTTGIGSVDVAALLKALSAH